MCPFFITIPETSPSSTILSFEWAYFTFLRTDFTFSKVRTSKNTIDVRGLRVHEAEIIIEEKMRKVKDFHLKNSLSNFLKAYNDRNK